MELAGKYINKEKYAIDPARHIDKCLRIGLFKDGERGSGYYIEKRGEWFWETFAGMFPTQNKATAWLKKHGIKAMLYSPPGYMQ
jgi:hypothetical protein